MKTQAGFTLIELMVTVIIVAILASIALPSYQEYVRRQRLSVAKQEMNIIAGELERFKSKNFSYKDFGNYMSATYADYKNTAGTLDLPLNEPTKHYRITLVGTDTAGNFGLLANSDGFSWAMTAERIGGSVSDQRNYDLFMNSQGERCQTTDFNVVQTYAGCGDNSETW